MVELANVVNDLTVGSLQGIKLVDRRNLLLGDQRDGSKILADVLRDMLLKNIRPRTELCEQQQPDHESALFAKAEQENPGITYARFLEQAGDAIVRDDSDCDPRLPFLTLGVTTPSGQLLGLFVIYNMEILSDVSDITTLTAMPMPGCRAAPGFSLQETWSEIMDWILFRDFIAPGGKKVDLVGWRFPTRDTHRWKLTDEEKTREGNDATDAVADRIIQRLEAGNVDVIKDSRGAPISIRRRGGTL